LSSYTTFKAIFIINNCISYRRNSFIKAHKSASLITMDYHPAAALAIFIVTLFLMIKRPRGINLGLAAGIGAAASLLFGTVTLSDAAAAFLTFGTLL
jgi:hypothetical protein